MKLPKGLQNKKLNEDNRTVLSNYNNHSMAPLERKCKKCKQVKLCASVTLKKGKKKVHLCRSCYFSVLEKLRNKLFR